MWVKLSYLRSPRHCVMLYMSHRLFSWLKKSTVTVLHHKSDVSFDFLVLEHNPFLLTFIGVNFMIINNSRFRLVLPRESTCDNLINRINFLKRRRTWEILLFLYRALGHKKKIKLNRPLCAKKKTFTLSKKKTFFMKINSHLPLKVHLHIDVSVISCK